MDKVLDKLGVFNFWGVFFLGALCSAIFYSLFANLDDLVEKNTAPVIALSILMIYAVGTFMHEIGKWLLALLYKVNRWKLIDPEKEALGYAVTHSFICEHIDSVNSGVQFKANHVISKSEYLLNQSFLQQKYPDYVKSKGITMDSEECSKTICSNLSFELKRLIKDNRTEQTQAQQAMAMSVATFTLILLILPLIDLLPYTFDSFTIYYRLNHVTTQFILFFLFLFSLVRAIRYDKKRVRDVLRAARVYKVGINMNDSDTAIEEK